jgi:two-component system OmpR family response regulator
MVTLFRAMRYAGKDAEEWEQTMKILLVEDDAQVREYIRQGLEEAGHTVDVAETGKTGLFLATTETFDIIVLDRMLPELDGLTLLKTIRGAENTTPVLILSALGDVDDRVAGLRAGGDDYLVKPFAFAELMARIEVMGRRGQGQAANNTELKVGDLSVDLLARKVTRGGKPVELQTREFRLLAYLLEHKGQLVTRTMLLEAVWDYHFDPQTNVIDVHISRLRKKIEDKGNQIIKTVRGSGYIIEDQL